MDPKEYDRLVVEFLDGKISFDEFNARTPAIPIPNRPWPPRKKVSIGRMLISGLSGAFAGGIAVLASLKIGWLLAIAVAVGLMVAFESVASLFKK